MWKEIEHISKKQKRLVLISSSWSAAEPERAVPARHLAPLLEVDIAVSLPNETRALAIESLGMTKHLHKHDLNPEL